jgi:hypothetical protein
MHFGLNRRALLAGFLLTLVSIAAVRISRDASKVAGTRIASTPLCPVLANLDKWPIAFRPPNGDQGNSSCLVAEGLVIVVNPATEVNLTSNGVSMVVSGLPDHFDLVSPSPPRLAVHFLRAGAPGSNAGPALRPCGVPKKRAAPAHQAFIWSTRNQN